ncbi:MAG: hypothetical protein DMF68_22075 [Acidobacteria bacterium]|nr:MAG: hypothetical protein DMF68_22075 [Acidobacteriota bacterium]
MFLLKALTPAGREVLLIDGNPRPMNEEELVRYVIKEKIELVGIGAMTRMVARAYNMADAIRGAGVPVVMGGPHVTEDPTITRVPHSFFFSGEGFDFFKIDEGTAFHFYRTEAPAPHKVVDRIPRHPTSPNSYPFFVTMPLDLQVKE